MRGCGLLRALECPRRGEPWWLTVGRWWVFLALLVGMLGPFWVWFAMGGR